MNVSKVSERIRRFVQTNRGILRTMPSLQSQMLELAAVIAAADHYKSFGFEIEFRNPGKRRSFVVKSSSRGHPWNFSRIIVKRHQAAFEIHMNLSVRSARDPGIYCVDVGVTQPNIVPAQVRDDWVCLSNDCLITFAEVKKLVVYPMLLAHFIGIVHELTPQFLQKYPPGFEEANHFSPALITVGYSTANSRQIIEAYKERGIFVNVEANFDMRFSVSEDGYRFGAAELPVAEKCDTQISEAPTSTVSVSGSMSPA